MSAILFCPVVSCQCLFRVFCLSVCVSHGIYVTGIWNPVTGDMEVLVTSLTHDQYGNERALYSQRICSSGNVLLSDWPMGFHLPCGINNMWLPCLSLLLQSNSCLWWEWSACVLTCTVYTHQVTIRIYYKLDSFFHVHEVSSLFMGSLEMVPGSYIGGESLCYCILSYCTLSYCTLSYC